MSISAISPAVALSHASATANKTPVNPVQQASKPVVPPAVKSGADSDGDHDGSGGGINVKA
jgi:hypothetical protein